MTTTTRSLLARRDPERRAVENGDGPDHDVITRRFAPETRKEIRRLLRLSPRLVDLSLIFPGALYAIVTSRQTAEQRRHALDMVLDGAALKQIAEQLELPMWLRRLPPEAFTGTLPPLPQSEAFARRIVNCLPPTRAESSLWLKAVTFAAEAAHDDFAVWLAHQPVFGSDGDARRLFAVLAAYTWFSSQPYKPAHSLMIVPWRPEISFETALCAAKSWLNRLRLTLQLKPGVIDDPWLEPGETNGFCFVPLLDATALLEEAQAMHNCADQYADRIARDRCRLWSIRRRNGQRLATLEIGQHAREPGVLDLIQLKARHNLPASLEVWQAAHAWMSTQTGLRRAPTMVLPTRQLDAAQWAGLMQPYRDQKDGAPWLPTSLTLSSLATLDSDLADLARRASVTSWLFT